MPRRSLASNLTDAAAATTEGLLAADKGNGPPGPAGNWNQNGPPGPVGNGHWRAVAGGEGKEAIPAATATTEGSLPADKGNGPPGPAGNWNQNGPPGPAGNWNQNGPPGPVGNHQGNGHWRATAGEEGKEAIQGDKMPWTGGVPQPGGGGGVPGPGGSGPAQSWSPINGPPNNPGNWNNPSGPFQPVGAPPQQPGQQGQGGGA
jgi:hypothetical protein